MLLGNIDYIYTWLLEHDLFTEAELTLITDMCGYNLETLNTAVYCRYGYRSVIDLMKEIRQS